MIPLSILWSWRGLSGNSEQVEQWSWMGTRIWENIYGNLRRHRRSTEFMPAPIGIVPLPLRQKFVWSSFRIYKPSAPETSTFGRNCDRIKCSSSVCMRSKGSRVWLQFLTEVWWSSRHGAEDPYPRTGGRMRDLARICTSKKGPDSFVRVYLLSLEILCEIVAVRKRKARRISKSGEARPYLPGNAKEVS